MKSLYNIFHDDQIEYIRLGKKEGYKTHREWLQLFAKKLQDSNGKFNIRNYIWESYMSGLLPSISGNKVITLYQSKPIESYYVIYENGREVFYCKSETWPSFFANEVIVLPESKNWSVVFSHEETVHYVEPET